MKKIRKRKITGSGDYFYLQGTNKAYLQFMNKYEEYKQNFYALRLSVGRTKEQVQEEFRDAMRRHNRAYIFCDLIGE
jgi:hypothetical protein